MDLRPPPWSWALLLWLVAAPAHAGQPEQPAPPRLRLLGVRVESPYVARRAAGPPPAGAAAQRRWLPGALQRIRQAYRARGYDQVRAWGKLDRKGRLLVEVDEGRVELVFHGENVLRNILFRVDIDLPSRVFHRATLERSLKAFKAKYNLLNVLYRVTEQGDGIRNRLGRLVARRRLQIYFIAYEYEGWGMSLSLSSAWGILPRVKFSGNALLLKDDRLAASLEVAFPYRRFIFEQDPEFQWVHTRLEADYRFPRLGRLGLAPLLDTETAVSRYAREDPNLRSYYTYHAEGLANISLLLPPRLTLNLGAGATFTKVFGLEQARGATAPIPSEQSLTRFVARLDARFTFDRELQRHDLRNELRVSLLLGLNGDADYHLSARVWAQFVRYFWSHVLIIRARAVAMAGDVRFWDDVELAGRTMRAFFDNRYWVHEALQLSVELRFTIFDWWQVGLFNDVAGFYDRTRDPAPAALANALGPGLHFLAFDLFTVDVYYAFGFSPDGFDHNISFRVHKAF